MGSGRSDRLHHVLEVRHPSFVTPELIELLQTYRVAACVADSAGKYPAIEDLCGDIVYVRLHGAKQLYASGYSDRELTWWATRIRRWSVGRPASKPRVIDPNQAGDGQARDVFVYFDNDVKVHAPFDALHLAALLANPGAAGRRTRRFAVRTAQEWLRRVAPDEGRLPTQQWVLP